MGNQVQWYEHQIHNNHFHQQLRFKLLFAGELILGSPPSYLPLPVLETDFKDNWYGFLTGQMAFISSGKQYHNTAGVFKNQQKKYIKNEKNCLPTNQCLQL